MDTIRELSRQSQIKKAIFDDRDASIRIKIKDIEEGIEERSKQKLLSREKSLEEKIMEQVCQKR